LIADAEATLLKSFRLAHGAEAALLDAEENLHPSLMMMRRRGCCVALCAARWRRSDGMGPFREALRGDGRDPEGAVIGRGR